MINQENLSSSSDFVLIVDDVPENLSVLHDALEETGYAVLVATDGSSALTSARQTMPSIILLDALMPGMDGFEVCRMLKSDIATRHIPVVFMTGLSEAEHVVKAFAAGGTDYVTKPVRPTEVLARIATHMQSSRLMSQARSALDAFGRATIALMPDSGELVWQTPLARSLMAKYAIQSNPETMDAIQKWLEQAVMVMTDSQETAVHRIDLQDGSLVFRLFEMTEDGECLIVLHEESDTAQIETLIHALRLTRREAEVLYWVILGKTNRDIGDILGMSPRTVNKHLEHVYQKLNVETRTAAAAYAMSKVRTFKATSR